MHVRTCCAAGLHASYSAVHSADDTKLYLLLGWGELHASVLQAIPVCTCHLFCTSKHEIRFRPGHSG